MLTSEKTLDQSEPLLKKAIEYVENRGFKNIKTKLDGYESPNSFAQKKKDNEYTPDITAENARGKFYFEIAQKTDKVNSLVSKWKLLATLAEMKNGGFCILVPYGLNKFTEDLVNNYKIDANLIKMS